MFKRTILKVSLSHAHLSYLCAELGSETSDGMESLSNILTSVGRTHEGMSVITMQEKIVGHDDIIEKATYPGSLSGVMI